jgi:hypothetical protein
LAGVILMSALGHLVIGHENEIYGHFTCDDEVARFQWTWALLSGTFSKVRTINSKSICPSLLVSN